MENLQKMRFKRDNKIGQMTRLQEYYQGIDLQNLTKAAITQLEYRLIKFESIYDEFNELQIEIEFNLDNCEEIDLQSIANETKIRIDFENSYYNLVTSIKDTITSFNKQNSVHQINTSILNDDNELDEASNLSITSNMSRNSQVCSVSQIKLPTIKLPTFNGAYNCWLEYRDSFIALVDNNNSISEIQKFYYLRSSLEGEAARIIESIEVSASNYTIAWDLLKERFENKRLLIHNYIKTLFDAPVLIKESHSELRKLFDTFTRSLRSLEKIGLPTKEWDALIIFILTSKFDNVTKRDWESYKTQDEFPKMQDINTFLKNKCDILEKLEVNKSDNHFIKQKNKYQNKNYSSSHVSTSENTFSCYYCKAKHTIYQCDEFKKLDVHTRINEAIRLKLCKNCLQPGHTVQECTKSNCRKCKRKHNSMLHFNRANVTDEVNKTQNSNLTEQDAQASTVVGHTINNNVSQILLSTALVNVTDHLGNIHTARVLLDQGSQSHFITKSLCNKLHLKQIPVDCAITGVGKVVSEAQYETSLTITSRVNNFSINISCLVLPMITQSLPLESFNKSILDLPRNIQLADPGFNISSDIDILLGINAFYNLLCMKQICKSEHPVLQKTKLGWVVGGNLCYSKRPNKIVSCHSIGLKEIDKTLSKFWDLENENMSKQPTGISDDICESHFLNTYKRDNTGRFVVDIPFKNNLDELGDSREQARNRFLNLEGRFAKNQSLKKDYSEFMTEYEKLGHMTKIIEKKGDGLNYYMPHQAVIKSSSITTRVRVVFDASAKTRSNLSLNDVQYAGPTIQSDLLSILLRFRQHKYVISADISKMYRQVLINPEHRRFQRIFWRTEPDHELECYELNTVTYGTSSAPFLAVRSLYQLGLDNVTSHSKTSQVIMNDFYVDDLLSGTNSAEELVQLQKEVTSILKGGGFELRKWLSNYPELTSKFLLNENLESSILSLGEHEQNKTLGIMWNSKTDTIQYSIRQVNNIIRLTKRHILSITAQIFDPLGLLGPVVIIAKLTLQLLWQEKLTWDDPVSDNVCKKWNAFCKDLSVLNNLEIPRHVITSGNKNVELNAFADASQSAYGACVYLRCKLNDNSYGTRLLCAKSRVAPIKTVSLPRLELCAALLLAKLVSKVRSSLNTTFTRSYYWSDSTITLCWIRKPPNNWKTFIANRVSEIQQLTNIDDWHHVSSENNPADLLSRGVSCEQLLQSKLWWYGPSFLEQDSSSWKSTDDSVYDSVVIPEQRILSNVKTTEYFDLDLFTRYSSILKLQRITAYCYRFISNLRNTKERRVTGSLTISELNNALYKLIKISQVQSFTVDYRTLENKGILRKGSNILSLNPFMDDKQLIRVGGRLQNANVSYNQRHPILLHNKHILTKLLMTHEHHKMLHCGPQQLLYTIRENYWPISGRSLARDIVRKCVICFKAKPNPSQYIMGNLPTNRVNQFSPFENTGIDHAGPLQMKDRKTRGAKLLKVYICIFICLSTKAIHIELVTDLTTEAFLATLRRFIARRGKPSNIYSDNSKTFVGADSALTRLINSNSEKIATELSTDGITWHFIPPRSPNFGGLWEAGVKSIKNHLKRVLGNAYLTYEELITVLNQIEGILNSRPLYPQSSDPNDPHPLTPGHFLIGKPITSIPESNLINKNENYLSKYQRLQQLMQHFWKRWQSEYISELQSRSKWRQQTSDPIQLNDLVIVKEDNLPPGQWRLGRILQLHPGSDGVVRVVTIKCSEGVVKRSLNKVCKLPK